MPYGFERARRLKLGKGEVEEGSNLGRIKLVGACEHVARALVVVARVPIDPRAEQCVDGAAPGAVVREGCRMEHEGRGEDPAA